MPTTELLHFEDFVIQHSAASTFASPTTIARVSQMTINDQYQIFDIDDFDQAAGDILDRLLGARSIDLTFTVSAVPSDAGFQAIHADKKTGTRSFFGVDAPDTNTTVTTLRLRLGGYWNQFTLNFAKPIVTATIGFSADEVISDDIS